jgi:hypothetical protein
MPDKIVEPPLHTAPAVFTLRCSIGGRGSSRSPRNA